MISEPDVRKHNGNTPLTKPAYLAGVGFPYSGGLIIGYIDHSNPPGHKGLSDTPAPDHRTQEPDSADPTRADIAWAKRPERCSSGSTAKTYRFGMG